MTAISSGRDFNRPNSVAREENFLNARRPSEAFNYALIIEVTSLKEGQLQGLSKVKGELVETLSCT